MTWDNIMGNLAASFIFLAIVSAWNWRSRVSREQKAEAAAYLAKSIEDMGGSRERRIEFMLKRLYSVCFYFMLSMGCFMFAWTAHTLFVLQVGGFEPLTAALSGSSAAFTIEAIRILSSGYAAVIQAEAKQRNTGQRQKPTPTP